MNRLIDIITNSDLDFKRNFMTENEFLEAKANQIYLTTIRDYFKSGKKDLEICNYHDNIDFFALVYFAKIIAQNIDVDLYIYGKVPFKMKKYFRNFSNKFGDFKVTVKRRKGKYESNRFRLNPSNAMNSYHGNYDFLPFYGLTRKTISLFIKHYFKVDINILNRYELSKKDYFNSNILECKDIDFSGEIQITNSIIKSPISSWKQNETIIVNDSTNSLTNSFINIINENTTCNVIYWKCRDLKQYDKNIFKTQNCPIKNYNLADEKNIDSIIKNNIYPKGKIYYEIYPSDLVKYFEDNGFKVVKYTTNCLIYSIDYDKRELVK